MNKVSIGFFDDHPILLEGLVNIFSRFNDFTIVERGVCAADAVRAALTRRLDVIVLDLAMPGDVFDAISTICLERPETKMIAFTASVGVDSAVRALDAGASGYVIKGSTADELYSAIHAVLRGETFITQSFADARVFAVDQVMRAGEDLAAQSQLILDAPSIWSIDARGDVTSSDAKKAGEYRMYETKLFGPKRMLRGAVDRAVSP